MSHSYKEPFIGGVCSAVWARQEGNWKCPPGFMESAMAEEELWAEKEEREESATTAAIKRPKIHNSGLWR